MRVESSSAIKRLREFVQLDLVGVRPASYPAASAPSALQRDEVTPALAEEAIREAVTKLVRGERATPARLQTRQTILISACALAGYFGSC